MDHIEFILASVTVVLVLSWLICRFLLSRRTSRDLVWRTALIVVALIPGLSLARSVVPWHWPISILPARNVASQQPMVAPTQPTSTDGRSFTAARGVMKPIHGLPDQVPPIRISDHDSLSHSDQKIEISKTASASSFSTVASLFPILLYPWLTPIVLVWLVGILIQCIRIGMAFWKAQRLVSFAETVTLQSLIDLNDWSANRVGLSRRAKLLASSRIDVPVVCGLLRPKIVVPPCLLTQLPQQSEKTAFSKK